MKQKARIGIIGTGWWATEAHIPAVLAHNDAILVAICDRDPERLNVAAQAFDIARTYTNYHAMLAQEALDGVIIATPHATHYAIGRDCLNYGLHILLEKPMTLHAWEARELVHLAAEKERALVIGYPYVFLPQIIKAREVIQSGELGAVQYVTCTFASHVLDFLSGNVSKDNAPHAFTVQGPSTAYNDPKITGGGEGHLQITHIAGILFFITGLRARQVHALMANHSLAVDLVDAMVASFDNGALGLVGGTGNAGRNHKMSLSIYCEGGCFDADTRLRHIHIRRADGSEISLGSPPMPSLRVVTTRNLIDIILGRAKNGSPGEVGWHAVELLDAAYRSAGQNGRRIMIHDLYE